MAATPLSKRRINDARQLVTIMKFYLDSNIEIIFG